MKNPNQAGLWPSLIPHLKLPPVLVGPALALTTISVLEAFAHTRCRDYLPFPVSILVVAVIYSVFRSGRPSGLISALLTMIYFAYFLWANQSFVHDPADAWNRLVSWTVALPVIVAIVGRLKRNAVAAEARIERMTSAAKIQIYKQRSEMVLENISAVIWAIDLNGIFTFSEGKILQAIGVISGERIGKSIYDIYANKPEVTNCARRALAGEACKSTFEVKGIWFECHFSPSRTPEGEIIGVVGVAINVTTQVEIESTRAHVNELERAQTKLREKTRQLETLINTSPVGILTLDKDRRVVMWNRACEKTFGWTAEETIGNLLPFVGEDHREESMKIIERIHLTREPVHFEADRIRKDGSSIRTATAAIPLLDDQGQVSGLLAVMMDNTEQYRARQEILEANRALQMTTQAKSDFLANMSHEIRTPINGVIGMTSLLLDLELGKEQKQYAETIRSSAEILLSLVNDILDFSKIEAGKLDFESIDFDLDQVVHNVEKLLSVNAQRKQIKLVRSMTPDLRGAFFKGDPTRVGQIVSNLIANAIKFTEQGQITVGFFREAVPADAIDPSLSFLRIEVSDTGMGMSPEVLSRMFQPFSQADNSTTRRFGGTGLGLSICKQLVDLLGGRIGVRSVEGKGSTFWFTLALKPSDTHRVVVEKPEARIVSRDGEPKIRILLAEDNPVNQIIAVKTLEKYGFCVDAVANGREAVEAVNSIPYDLILMDCQMPELDGYEAARRIRLARDPKVARIPIIAMTADAMPGTRERCLDAGMNDYVTKPIRPASLVEVIFLRLKLEEVPAPIVVSA